MQGIVFSRQQHSIVLTECDAEAVIDVSSPLFKEVATQLKTGSYLLAIGHVAIGAVRPVIKAHKVSKPCMAAAMFIGPDGAASYVLCI